MEEAIVKDFLERDDLRTITGLAADLGVDAFLVGGALRDLLLGREANDLDFALSGACTELPRIFAKRISGTFFWLDEVRQQARVVKKQDNTTAVYDFAPLCGATIMDDLARRDFTINALAIPLFGERRELIDPLAGRDDLRLGVVTACGAAAFHDDPLRLLRAIRFSAELDFEIEGNTWETLCQKSCLLGRVAAERIRDELFRILAATGCGASLRKLCTSGLLPEIVAAIEASVCAEGIARAEAAERLYVDSGRRFADEGKRLADYFNREVEEGISALSLIKLASFLGSGEKGEATSFAERFRLGREAGRMLECLCRDEKGLYRVLERIATERVMFRFFRDREAAGPGMLILARVAGAVTEACFSRLMRYYLREYNVHDPDLFLNGGEVMKILGIAPGKAVGEAMARLREAESIGMVNSMEEAREFIKNLLTKEEPMR